MLYILKKRIRQALEDTDRICRTPGIRLESWRQRLPRALPKSEMPEVEAAVRLMTFTDISKMLVKTNWHEKAFFEPNDIMLTQLFQVLDFPFVTGNARTASQNPIL
jgi:hypothetical protein